LENAKKLSFILSKRNRFSQLPFSIENSFDRLNAQGNGERVKGRMISGLDNTQSNVL